VKEGRTSRAYIDTTILYFVYTVLCWFSLFCHGALLFIEIVLLYYTKILRTNGWGLPFYFIKGDVVNRRTAPYPSEVR
jgi:hypothetical protein